MDDITREQIRRNEESRSGWEKYEWHRETVTQLILDSAGNGDSLTVLGAGNCNDIDLGLLADHFEIISLVDVDRTAIETGLGRQNFSLDDKGFQVCETDVTGILSRLNKLGLAENSGADKLLTVAKLTTEFQPTGLPSPADVVVSTGLITQLVEAAIKMVGEASVASLDSPGLHLVQAVRRRHLRLLSDLTNPGGTTILVTEIVSSKTVPGLPDARREQLPALLQSCLASGNFFTGLHPGIIYQEMMSPEFGCELEGVRLTPPWLWEFTARTYAVVALSAKRRIG